MEPVNIGHTGEPGAENSTDVCQDDAHEVQGKDEGQGETAETQSRISFAVVYFFAHHKELSPPPPNPTPPDPTPSPLPNTHFEVNDSGDTEVASSSGHKIFVGCRGSDDKMSVETVYTQDMDSIIDNGQWCKDGSVPIWVGNQLISGRNKEGNEESCTTLPDWTEANGTHCCRSQNEVCRRAQHTCLKTITFAVPVFCAFCSFILCLFRFACHSIQ